MPSLSSRNTVPLPSAREYRFVEAISDVPSIRIGHRPHCPANAPESAILHRGGEMEGIVSDTLISQLHRLAGREKRELCIEEWRPYNVEQSKVLAFIKLGRSVNGFPGSRLP